MDAEAEMQKHAASQPGDRPRRARPREVAQKTAARRLIADVQKQLGGWHAELASLRASLGAQHEDPQELRMRASAFSARVRVTQMALQATLQSQAEGHIAQHSIVRDAMRSLHSLRSQLDELSMVQ
jgi:hypothetical protein